MDVNSGVCPRTFARDEYSKRENKAVQQHDNTY
jgi:hypothetical protein